MELDQQELHTYTQTLNIQIQVNEATKNYAVFM